MKRRDFLKVVAFEAAAFCVAGIRLNTEARREEQKNERLYNDK
jgi:hypothetical protein